MTVAEFGYTWEQSDELRKALESKVQSGQFTCDSIEYAVPNEQFFFERKLRFPLGRFRTHLKNLSSRGRRDRERDKEDERTNRRCIIGIH
jgi:hypothetical protein